MLGDVSSSWPAILSSISVFSLDVYFSSNTSSCLILSSTIFLISSLGCISASGPASVSGLGTAVSGEIVSGSGEGGVGGIRHG